MALQLVNKGWDITRKKKKSFLLLAAFGVTGYGAYRVYNLPSVVRKRERLMKLLTAFVYLAESVSDSAETFGIISKDLREFLQSDSDEIPNSLRQISKIARSKEFSDSIVRVTAALSRGVLRGYQAEQESSRDDGVDSGSGFYDRFMDKLFSDSGKGFASVVVGSFAKNLVLAFYSNQESEGQSNSGVNLSSSDSQMPGWVEVMCNEKCRELVGDYIQKFVSAAVAVYLEKTMDINTYDDLFAGLTNPKHEKQVRDMLVSVCNGSIETLVKTSHQVLTASSNLGSKLGNSDSSDLSCFVVTRSNSDVVSRTFYPQIDDAHNVISVKQNGQGKGGAFFELMEGRDSSDKSRNSGWVSTMSSTLAVPSNRKLVLDVTGRVTFMTVRTFLEFLLEKVFATVKRSVHFVNEAIVESGLRAVRYVTAKSSVIATICLSVCLHIFGGSTWALMPA